MKIQESGENYLEAILMLSLIHISIPRGLLRPAP